MRQPFRIMAAALCLLFLLISSAGGFVVAAEGTSNSYIYDSLQNAVESPASYLVEQVITGGRLGIGEFSGASDIYVRDNQLYLLDSGNNRILKFSKDFTLLETVFLKDEQGTDISLGQATGLFVTLSGDLYVADEGQKVVWMSDAKGQIYKRIESPEADVLPDGFDYRPSKVVEDSAGVIYVLSKGTIGGALQYDGHLNFMGFYGSEKVTASAQIFMQRLWRRFMTKEQQEGMADYAPPSYSNFDIGPDDFVYTIRDQANSRYGQVRKLNAVGNNILTNGEKTIFGDVVLSSKFIDSLLTDIEVDDDGFILVLDERRGRVFQYDQNSNLLSIFGGKADQEGTFKTATALESIDGKLVVLDKDNATLTVFEPTPFTAAVRQAVMLDQDGRYEEAIAPWKQVLKMNANYELANRGMGKALIELGDYKQAMAYFRQGRDKDGYSDAFEEYRSGIINRWFPLVLLVIVLLVAVPLYFIRRSAVRARNEYHLTISRGKYPLYCMLHPFKGFERMKEDKKGSLPMALALLAVFFVISIVSRQATGFQFNTNRVDQFNIFVQCGKTVGVVLIFVLANWMVSTIMDGKGTLKEVLIFGGYALMPYIVCTIPAVLISNIAVANEHAFYMMFLGVIQAWMVLCILMAVKEVHQFTVTKTLFVTLLTIIGIVLLMAIIAIVYSMFVQMFAWISTIANELLLRM